MINLRMIGLASALLLLLPIGVAALPDGGDEEPVLDGYQEATATVYDVVLARLPHEKGYEPESLHEEERLVEGHTVFVVIDVVSYDRQANGSVDIMGMVDCKANAKYSGPTFLGIPLPERVDSVEARCRVDEHVIVTPDPFNDPPMAALQPTGRLLPFTIPGVGQGYAEELQYPVQRQDAHGATETAIHYAWKVPIWGSWLDADGRPKNFYAPLPEDRLLEMGVQDFEVYHENDWPGPR